MPHMKLTGCRQQKHGRGAQGGKGVATEHGSLLIPTVAKSTCEDAHQHIWGIGAYGEQGCGQGGALILIRPEHKGETGHGAAQSGQQLGEPKDQKGLQLTNKRKDR